MNTRHELLARAVEAWHFWVPFRQERRRNKRYTYGRQWEDTVMTPKGRMTEAEALRRDGETPLANNMIRRTVRNIVGLWRSQYAPPAGDDDLTLRLRETLARNRFEELCARTLEEFLISGLAIHRQWYGYRGGTLSAWTDFVSPADFFMETDPKDFRGWDLTLAGEVHELTFDTLCARFACTPAAVEALRAVYGVSPGETPPPRPFGIPDDREGDLLLPSRPGLCRVIEVWRPETQRVLVCHDTAGGRMGRFTGPDADRLADATDAQRGRIGLPPLIRRPEMSEVWTWSFLTPTGHVLAEGTTPYAHASHPFTVKAYPFIDGEVHSFVSDIIDQQRFANRLITIYDRALRASAKGVLLFPEHALVPGADLREVADQWSRADGVIMYSAKAGMPIPQQAGGLSAAMGIADLLQIQLKMMEDISGVNSALQGKLESQATSGALYERQTVNALTSIRDITASFASFVDESRRKLQSVISNR